MPYDEKIIKWADNEMKMLIDTVTNECILCNMIKNDDTELIDHLFKGVKNEEIKDKYKEYHKKYRKEKPESRLSPSKINIRLGQISNLNVIYRSIYSHDTSTEYEKEKAKENKSESCKLACIWGRCSPNVGSFNRFHT